MYKLVVLLLGDGLVVSYIQCCLRTPSMLTFRYSEIIHTVSNSILTFYNRNS